MYSLYGLTWINGGEVVHDNLKNRGVKRTRSHICQEIDTGQKSNALHRLSMA
ncbi:MAG: hypothetical protein PHU97_08945 [Bacteroidales bacterium]|nr:hypothetical protein [Bacteroidales bacterium]